MFYFILCTFPYDSYFMQNMRWPVFALGVFVGWYMNNRGTVIKAMAYKGILILAITGIVLTYIVHLKYCQPRLDPTIVPEIKKTGWLYFPYFPIVLGFCLILAYFLSFKQLKFVDKSLSCIGQMSLEIYLLHTQFIQLTRYLTNEYLLSKSIVGSILVIMSFICAYYLHKINSKCMRMILNKCGYTA